MRNRSRWITDRTVPVFLLLITIAAFGLLIPWLGFYWDDWAKILVSRLWGLGAYFRYYAEDRPISSWTHIVLTPILGESPLPWHVFTLLLRWLSAWGMWWSLRAIWPAARRQNLLATLLFLIYPAFVSQPVAVTFHQQWLQFALFFLSLGAMLRAAKMEPQERRDPQSRRPALLLTGLALLAQALQISVTEYFVPLELLRPVALWILFRGERMKPRLWRTLRAAWPYLLLLAIYVVWRLFFINLPGEDPYRANTLYAFIEDPLGTLRSTLLVALADEIRILVTSWADLLYLQVSDAARFTLLSYGAGAAVGAAVFMALMGYSQRGETSTEEADASAGWVREAFLLGLAAVLLGPVPAWITGRQVVFDFHSDRYAMPAIFGAGLLLAAAIEWLTRRRLQAAVLAGVLVALATGLHLRVANDYRWVWEEQQRFFWQLSWRAPGLRGPTAIFLENEPFANQGLFSTSAALNLLYPQPEGFGQQVGDGQLAYWVYSLRPRYSKALDSYQIGLKTTFRTLTFQGQTPDSLLIYKNPARGNCIWVLRPEDVKNPDLPQLVRDFLPIANPARIDPQPNPGYPLADLLGAEPEHGWCYYYQKAALARQLGDWQTAARLADEAQALGFAPNRSGSNASFEWLPMIEGLLRVERHEDAAALTRAAYEHSPRYGEMLCDLWQGQGNSPVTEMMGCAQ